jgi:hypothetical protein
MRPIIGRLVPLAAAACVLLSAPAARATSTPAEVEASVTKGVTYLKSAQQTNGGFASDWDLSSFASAGVAAANVKNAGASTDARTWYRELVGNTSTWPKEARVTEDERAALNGYAAGIDPGRVSKTQNLIAQIASYYQTANPGYYGEPSVFEGTVFALLALADTKTRTGLQRVPQALLEKSIAVVDANQHIDGGWNYRKAEGSEEIRKSASEPLTPAGSIRRKKASRPTKKRRRSTSSSPNSSPGEVSGTQRRGAPSTNTQARMRSAPWRERASP